MISHIIFFTKRNRINIDYHITLFIEYSILFHHANQWIPSKEQNTLTTALVFQMSHLLCDFDWLST